MPRGAADRVVEAGRLGQKTDKVWYAYAQGKRTPQVDPETEAMMMKLIGTK